MNTQTGQMSYGFASNLRDALPNAWCIGFTGTPIETTDANTRAIFGDYISIYDIQRAVADKATAPIYYESRISKLSLNAATLPMLDEEFEQITEGEDLTKKEKLKTKLTALRPEWASAKDDDGEADLPARRAQAGKGKACVVKVVMTGSAAAGPDWQPHVRSKDKRRALANRFKDPKDPFRIVIVRDMWLTGFDAPCLHIMQ